MVTNLLLRVVCFFRMLIQMEKSEKVLKPKILFTIMLMVIYASIRCIPLYYIDVAAYKVSNLDAENVLLQAVGSDANQYSVFALGIIPYMISNMAISIALAFIGIFKKIKILPKKMNALRLVAMMLTAFIQAVLRVKDLKFIDSGYLWQIQIIAVISLVTGAVLIMYICDYNKKYGIGGQGAVIFANIITGLLKNITERFQGKDIQTICIMLGICIFVLVLMIFLENSEYRMPVQRVSIHNIYADKNYIAVKLNPIGVMPIMFATGVFLLPQMFFRILADYFPDSSRILWINDNLKMSKWLGIVVYVLGIYILNIGFSFIMINPKEQAEKLLKGGDSIIDVRAGKATRRYLRKTLFGISFFSSTIMALCIGMPMYLQLMGMIDEKLAMLPATFMMLTGIATTVYQEYLSLKCYDEYRTFF